MTTSDSQIESAAASGLAEGAANTVTEYTIRGRKVVRDPKKDELNLKTLLMMRALQSPRRGLSLGKIDKPA